MISSSDKGRMGRVSKPLTDVERQELPRITKSLLKRIFSYLRPYWHYLVGVSLTILFAAILDMLPAILTGRIIDDGFIGGDFRLLIILIGVSLTVLLLSSLMGVFQSYLNTYVSQRITQDMRNQMYAHMQKLSHRFFTNAKQGEAITRITSDISGVNTVISGTLTNTLSNIAILLTSAVAMYQKNWVLATVGIIIVPLLVLPTKSVGKKRWALTDQSQQKQDAINQILNETLSVSGQQLVKLFTMESYEYQRYTAVNHEMFRLNIKESMAGRWFRMTINMLTSLGPLLIYFTGGMLLLRLGYADLTVGDITVMVALLSRMYRPVSSLLNIQVDFIRGMALFTRIFEYLDLPIEIESKPGARKQDSARGRLQFEHVFFSYVQNQTVLQNVSFTVEEGKTIALVGPSGAGKSTISHLIPRLYDVQQGRILLDDTDIRDWDLDNLRQAIGIVTQESYLFNATIRDNLLYAKPDATMDEIAAACREANIHTFISALPQGYETVVGNRGIKLSGGEKQRVAIARAILKNPRILIMDEATSSLDSISENLIQQAMVPLLRQRTSIVIAHRLSTIIAADDILVLQHGKIVQQGTHDKLLTQGGLYRQLYDTQFKHVFKTDTGSSNMHSQQVSSGQ